MKFEEPKLFNNTTDRVIDDLKVTVKDGSKISILAASFSMYAYQSLRNELDKIDELKFIFSGNDFTQFSPEKTSLESRQFEAQKINRELSLYGTDYEIKLKNELNQKAIAQECADWIRSKVTFKANKSNVRLDEFMTVRDSESEYSYNPVKNFTTSDLGVNQGDVALYTTTKSPAGAVTRQLIDSFDAIWQDNDKLTDVTEAVLENITAAYEENSPEFIYYLALYNIFNEFLDDINADFLPDERTGFKDSAIWNMLYKFQQDAVVGCISKLEKHNGCILADSVGLGKTFSALGVIKYYESRNKNVLVLCPKRLYNNWDTFRSNYSDNPIHSDRLNYEVLYHTDLSRDKGKSNNVDLGRINWGNYDLVVIDESHNFRNGDHTTHRKDEEYENRFQKLMNKVIKSGVKTKVLMLSATPVNISFSDLENQLKIATEGDIENLSDNLKVKTSIKNIFKSANTAFKNWSELPPEQRTTEQLLNFLSFDFFELLDSVTIARSRKHIETYYQDPNIGKFPERLKPISYRPELTDIDGINYNTLFDYIDRLNLAVYNPLKYVQPSKIGNYVDLSTAQGKSWENREEGRNRLMIIGLLKRAESSIHAFRLTAQRIFDFIDMQLDTIDKFTQGRGGEIDVEQFDEEEGEEDIAESLTVGRKFAINLSDMDYISWKQKLNEDKETLNELLQKIEPISPDHDTKLQELRQVIKEKITHPINSNNQKILIFTAYSETAEYLYDNLKDILLERYNLNSALVTGTRSDTTLSLIRKDFNEILLCFSPISKNRSLLGRDNLGNIDIVFATDCISEGQNLQDCDYLINYDIHWNPIRIIQRFGRIDRIGSKNNQIQLVNFWPNITLDEYINLKARVENRMKLGAMVAAGDNPIDKDPELAYRKKQLETLQNEVVDLEDMKDGINIMDLGLNEFHLDLQELDKKYKALGKSANTSPHGIHAVAPATDSLPTGVVFILKNRNQGVNIDKQNRLHPFYLVYIRQDGELHIGHLNPKDLLDNFRLLARGKDEYVKSIVKTFNRETNNGKKMDEYSKLLGLAIETIITTKAEKDVDSLFTSGGTSALENEIKGLDQFELIDFLVIKDENA